MNKKRIEEMIPIAINIIKSDVCEMFDTVDKTTDDEKKIPSKYFGYIASYGPTVRQSKLLQSVSFYHKDDRKRINKLIYKILKEAKIITNKDAGDLVECSKGKVNDSTWKSKVLEAIIASKLAMRTFKKGD